MSDNININVPAPDIGPYTQLTPFRFWCQKVLPLVYDESLSYYELLCKVVDYLNKTMEDVDQMIADMTDFRDTYIAFSRAVTNKVEELETYMDNYFENLDVQAEIDHKLDEMADDGYFSELFDTLFRSDLLSQAASTTSAWITENLSQEVGYVIDKSLTVEDAAADAKVVGDKFNRIETVLQKSPNLIVGKIAGASIDSVGKIVSQGTNDLFIAPVESGEAYIFTSNDVTYVHAFFTNYPELGDTSYDGSRATYANSFTAPITGYVVFRTLTDYAYAQITEGSVEQPYISPDWLSAIDVIAREENKDLVDTIFDIITPLTLPVPGVNSYYFGTVGSQIETQSGSGNYYSVIDLSAHVGKRVQISYTSSSTVSTRACAMCNAAGIINEVAYEKDIIIADKVFFDITAEYNQLYISTSSGATNLAVAINEPGVITKLNEINENCVYVDDLNGNDTYDGSKGAPFATIQKAVDSGALVIKVAAGEYYGFEVKDRVTPIKIMLWNMPNSYLTSVPEAPKIKITDHLVWCENCADVYLSDIWTDITDNDCFILRNIGKLECVRCFASGNTGTTGKMGFLITNTNGVFRDCKAWDIDKDGFNIHLYGDTQFINCVAYDCGDDGISHHEGCTGLILGGEYYNCGKAGVASPYGGAVIDIDSVYIHNNTRYGVYAVSGAEHNSSKGKISNCVIKNNTTYDIVVSKTDLVGWNNKYDTKYVYPDATFVEF